LFFVTIIIRFIQNHVHHILTFFCICIHSYVVFISYLWELIKISWKRLMNDNLNYFHKFSQTLSQSEIIALISLLETDKYIFHCICMCLSIFILISRIVQNGWDWKTIQFTSRPRQGLVLSYGRSIVPINF